MLSWLAWNLLGTAISDGNGKSHKASTAAWQRSSKSEAHMATVITFGFHLPLLCTWVTFNICITFAWWIPRSIVSKPPQESPEHTTPPTFREITLPTWMYSSYLEVCNTHKEARYLFSEFWDILIISLSVLNQEQDDQTKVNFTRSTKFCGLKELTAGEITRLFLLYTQSVIWHIKQQS